jgi:FkbM family methyltransferase
MRNLIQFLGHQVRDWTPLFLRRFLQRLANFFAIKTEAFPSIEASLQTLKQHGFNPQYCIDIGAYTGTWTAMFKDIFPDSKVLMIEAQEGKRADLESILKLFNKSVSYEIALLAAEHDKAVRFHEMETGSSVFEESSSIERTTKEVKTETLDSLLKRHSAFTKPCFLKLDTQGYELEILKGAEKTLPHVQAILLEASLLPINSGCPLIAEVIRFLDEKGFQLFDFCSQVRRNDQVLWQTDLLFLNCTSKFLPDPKLI